MKQELRSINLEKIWPLAEALGVARPLFQKYRDQGLPEKLLLPMLEIAPSKGIKVTSDELRALTRKAILSKSKRGKK